ncbi:hypothetical protein ACIA8K_03710 [Catenuloplanes sp. NPDC051500]|uniref:hypothetical protein n=1 Tax=Catenuloplanes sp. NPDC051500 TaxID=3363959 RepID=UPI0037B483AA
MSARFLIVVAAVVGAVLGAPPGPAPASAAAPVRQVVAPALAPAPMPRTERAETPEHAEPRWAAPPAAAESSGGISDTTWVRLSAMLLAVALLVLALAIIRGGNNQGARGRPRGSSGRRPRSARGRVPVGTGLDDDPTVPAPMRLPDPAADTSPTFAPVVPDAFTAAPAEARMSWSDPAIRPVAGSPSVPEPGWPGRPTAWTDPATPRVAPPAVWADVAEPDTSPQSQTWAAPQHWSAPVASDEPARPADYTPAAGPLPIPAQRRDSGSRGWSPAPSVPDGAATAGEPAPDRSRESPGWSPPVSASGPEAGPSVPVQDRESLGWSSAVSGPAAPAGPSVPVEDRESLGWSAAVSGPAAPAGPSVPVEDRESLGWSPAASGPAAPAGPSLPIQDRESFGWSPGPVTATGTPSVSAEIREVPGRYPADQVQDPTAPAGSWPDQLRDRDAPIMSPGSPEAPVRGLDDPAPPWEAPVRRHDDPADDRHSPARPRPDREAPVKSLSEPDLDREASVRSLGDPVRDRAAPVRSLSDPAPDREAPVKSLSDPVPGREAPVKSLSDPAPDREAPVKTLGNAESPVKRLDDPAPDPETPVKALPPRDATREPARGHDQDRAYEQDRDREAERDRAPGHNDAAGHDAPGHDDTPGREDAAPQPDTGILGPVVLDRTDGGQVRLGGTGLIIGVSAAAGPAATPIPVPAAITGLGVAPLASPLPEPVVSLEPVLSPLPDVPPVWRAGDPPTGEERPALPGWDDEAPEVRETLETAYGQVRVHLFGVASGAVPAYVWLAEGEEPPPATVPVVIGRKGRWWLHVDLARTPDVVTIVGPLDDCRRQAAALLGDLEGTGVSVAVVRDAMGGVTLPGARRLSRFPAPPAPGRVLQSTFVVLCTDPAPEARHLAAATAGHAVPVIMGEVPSGRWSIQPA